MRNKVLLSSIIIMAGISSYSLASNDTYYTSQSSYNPLSNSYSRSLQNDDSFLKLESMSHRFYGESREHNVSKIQFKQSLAAGKLHLNLSTGESEYNGVVGLTRNGTTVSFMSGNAESYIRDAGQYTDVYRYGLHGGNNVGFSFYGSAVDQKLNDKINAQFGFTKLSSDSGGLENRGSQYFQLASDNSYGRFSLLERGIKKMGYAVEAGHKLGNHNILIQHIKTTSGKELYRLKNHYALNHATDMVLDLSNVRDDKHYDQSRYSGLVSIAHRINAKPTLYSSLKTEHHMANRQKRVSTFKSTALVIGAGAVAVAAISSSGSDDTDNSSRFVSERDAAFDELNMINPVSVRENREHGGWVYRNKDNTYGSTTPVAGTVASVFLPSPSSVLPSGSQLTASYHTHGGPDPRYDNENFSPTDISSDVRLNIGGYLGTPGGAFKYHFNGNVRTLGTIATR